MFANQTIPNLEAIVAESRRIFSSGNGESYTGIELRVFPQTWPNTCGGFDIMPDGSPAIGGCAMTEEYTTVVHECISNRYIIWFGERPCYLVEEPSDEFLEDLSRNHMASLSEAKEKY